MVVSLNEHDLKSKLSAHWEYMLEMDTNSCSAVLVRSRQQLHNPLTDLPSQHCAALSAFADKPRHVKQRVVTLRGPLVCCWLNHYQTCDAWPLLKHLRLVDVPQLDTESISHLHQLSLKGIVVVDCFLDAAVLLRLSVGWRQLKRIVLQNNQLNDNAMSVIGLANWPNLQHLSLDFNILGTAGMQHLVSCSLPLLQRLTLEHAGIEEPAVRCLAQGQWPALLVLSLDGNYIDTTGVLYLLQGRWPLLKLLILSPEGLDREAASHFGIYGEDGADIAATPKPDTSRYLHSQDYITFLPQFPSLRLQIFVNAYESDGMQHVRNIYGQ